ncbi:MAG TPA: LysR substrate-binding domain-containing protein [Alphaproteobacteria bacterium]|jgi:LysR family nitrogen assimilation transcriptional regulator
MTIRQLRYFLRIVELKSFSKAAAYLHVAQPALGLQIRKLEEELGVKLLNRHSRGVSATEAGLILRDHALIVLRQIERAKLHLIDFAGPPRGKIAVGVTPTVNLVLASALVQKCREELPNVSLSIVEGMSENLMEWVENDRLDMAFSYNPAAVRGLVCEPMLTEDLCLVGPANGAALPPVKASTKRGKNSALDSMTFAEIAELPMILPSPPHGLRSIVDEVANAQDIELKITLEIDSVPATKELVEKDLGYTILGMGAIKREVDSGRLTARTITAPNLSRNMYLAYSSKRPSSKASNAVRQIIRGVVQDGITSGHWSWRAVE